jgi:hypothetical protein
MDKLLLEGEQISEPKHPEEKLMMTVVQIMILQQLKMTLQVMSKKRWKEESKWKVEMNQKTLKMELSMMKKKEKKLVQMLK